MPNGILTNPGSSPLRNLYSISTLSNNWERSQLFEEWKLVRFYQIRNNSRNIGHNPLFFDGQYSAKNFKLLQSIKEKTLSNNDLKEVLGSHPINKIRHHPSEIS
jgi:predicted RNA-binding protein with PUA-like domain